MVVLNHAFVPARDKVASAQWFARIFRVPYAGALSGRPAVRVRLNETLALDFVERERFEPLHLAFHVSDAEFDGILERLRGDDWPYGSGGGAMNDGQVNPRRFGRNVYFRDGNGHSLELLTRPEWDEPSESTVGLSSDEER